MELKHRKQVRGLALHRGFNRTFMELKLIHDNNRKLSDRVLIGPSWN